jgi:predicted amidohydrolase
MSIRLACTYDEIGLERFASESAPGSQDILILPELFDGGYARLVRDKGAASDPTRYLSRFEEISRSHRLNLVGGSIAWPDADGKVRNTCHVFANGKKLGSVSKTHLYRPLGDDQFFAAGTPGKVMTLDCGGVTMRTGIIICYDLRFPEIVRPWFKAGLDLLIVPARWPRVRDELWKLLLRARAVENQCFVVGVNSRDDEGGGSYAFDPVGDTLFALGPVKTAGEAPWHSFTIDPNAIADTKKRLDTRPDARLL